MIMLDLKFMNFDLCRNPIRRIVSALQSPYGDSLKAGNFKSFACCY